jgi:hypothetical protein
MQPGGDLIAAADIEHHIRLIDSHSGAVVADLRSERDAEMTSMAFSPDAATLYSCTSDAFMTRWDVRARKPIQSLKVPAPLVALCVYPDGSRVAAASTRTIHVWDSALSGELLTLEGPEGIRASFFSSDGTTLLASGGDAAFMAAESLPPACGFTARAHASRTREIVDKLQTANVAEEVIRRLEQDRTLSADDRAAAVALVQARGDPPNTLNSWAWGIARDSHRSESDYRLGERYVRAALKTWPNDHGFLNTLGVLQYRLCEYEQALESLMLSDAGYRKSFGGPHPADTAVLAMVHQRLKHFSQAWAALSETRELMKDSRFTSDPDTQGLCNEAEALLARGQ